MTITNEVITKEKKNFSLAPHFSDYDSISNNFSWQDAQKELVWFDSEHLNAAYNAVDRHAKNQNRNKVAIIYESSAGKIEKERLWMK